MMRSMLPAATAPVRALVLAMIVLAAAVTPMAVVMTTAQAPAATVEPWLEGAFAAPTNVTHAGDERLFVVEQAGTIQVIADAATAEPEVGLFLDITDRVGSEGFEQGLLSIAFAPESHGEAAVYASYTDLDGNSVISRFALSADGATADPASESVILTQEQPFENHNGGLILFGPDDMLYIGFGDGGSQGDPDENGQDLSTWLGKILRMDVNPANVAEGEAYAVPGDNPFVDDAEAAPEVWMYGLRNPWRFSFDAEGTMIAVADVGQNLWEEVTILPLDEASGANLGWNPMEGPDCYVEGCDTSAYVLPSVAYTHDEGGCSITGGEFSGDTYVYADFCTGLLWTATPGDGGVWTASEPIETGTGPTTFGLGADGTMYMGDGREGTLYRVVTGG